MDLFDFDFEGYSSYKAHKTRKERVLADRTRWDSMDGDLLLKILLQPLSSHDPEKSIKGFFDDLLTDREWEMLAKKLRAAQLIFLGAPYKAVAGMTGLRNASIASISKKMTPKRYGLYETMSDLRRSERIQKTTKPAENK